MTLMSFFFQGLVDSDTLPLNVSREMLQQHSSLKTIKKKLIRKALDMIRKIADEDPDENEGKDKKGTSSWTYFKSMTIDMIISFQFLFKCYYQLN